MEWSSHCNSPEHRWILRHHGVVLTGPPRVQFAEVPSGLLIDRMRGQIPGFMTDLAAWVRMEEMAWGQRYAVTTLCRMLFTVRYGTVTSKRRALLWAAEELDPRWREVVMGAERGRVRGWNPADRPDPELVEQTHPFAHYVTQIAVVSSADHLSRPCGKCRFFTRVPRPRLAGKSGPERYRMTNVIRGHR